MVVSNGFTPDKPGGYFFIWFSGFDNKQRQTSVAYSSYEEAIVEAFNLRIRGGKPLALCYVPPYDGKPEITLPVQVVENWEHRE